VDPLARLLINNHFYMDNPHVFEDGALRPFHVLRKVANPEGNWFTVEEVGPTHIYARQHATGEVIAFQRAMTRIEGLP